VFAVIGQQAIVILAEARAVITMAAANANSRNNFMSVSLSRD
jgi:hypothetical protein